MSVLLVDYGMGNLASARRSLQECGAHVIVSDDPRDIKNAERLVLPGVGAFPQAMKRLRERGWADAIRKAALDEDIPLLGICLGMQLLADESEEVAPTHGLGLVPGRIVRIRPGAANERVPHVGWNEVSPRANIPLFSGIGGGSDFYFVHSYHFEPRDPRDVLATTSYCGELVAAVGRGRIAGVQFHPEKSSGAGFRLLRNFLAL